MLKTCQFCGKVYKAYQSNRMFCSISCSNNAKIKGNEIKIFNDFAKITPAFRQCDEFGRSKNK